MYREIGGIANGWQVFNMPQRGTHWIGDPAHPRRMINQRIQYVSACESVSGLIGGLSNSIASIVVKSFLKLTRLLPLFTRLPASFTQNSLEIPCYVASFIFG